PLCADYGAQPRWLAGGHALRGLLQRPTLQRSGSRGGAARAARSQGKENDRPTARLERRRLRNPMKRLALLALLAVVAHAALSQQCVEFNKRWRNARKLAVAVAEAMPPNEYDFRPDPDAMSFGEQLIHLAQANFAFGAGLQDVKI